MPLSVVTASECSITENVIGKKCKYLHKIWPGFNISSNIPNHWQKWLDDWEYLPNSFFFFLVFLRYRITIIGSNVEHRYMITTMSESKYLYLYNKLL